MNNKEDIKLNSSNFNLPNEAYKRFFKKFNEIELIDISMWKMTHILGYFCKKYKEHYSLEFKFKFNSPIPSKCYELFLIKKIAANISSDPKILKDYIDWFFSTKIKQAKKRITSIAYLSNEGIVNDYKTKFLFNSTVDRSSPLPNNVLNILNNFNVQAKTYGDLAFISKMEDMPKEFSSALISIQTIGFNLNILDKIL